MPSLGPGWLVPRALAQPIANGVMLFFITAAFAKSEKSRARPCGFVCISFERLPPFLSPTFLSKLFWLSLGGNTAFSRMTTSV